MTTPSEDINIHPQMSQMWLISELKQWGLTQTHIDIFNLTDPANADQVASLTKAVAGADLDWDGIFNVLARNAYRREHPETAGVALVGMDEAHADLLQWYVQNQRPEVVNDSLRACAADTSLIVWRERYGLDELFRSATTECARCDLPLIPDGTYSDAAWIDQYADTNCWGDDSPHYPIDRNDWSNPVPDRAWPEATQLRSEDEAEAGPRSDADDVFALEPVWRELNAEAEAELDAEEAAERERLAIERMVKADNRVNALWTAGGVAVWAVIVYVMYRKASK